MKTYAVITNGIVENIIVGIEQEVLDANPNKYVEYTEENPAHIGEPYAPDGYIFNPITKAFQPEGA